MLKIPTEDRNKMAVMKELVEDGNYLSNTLLLKPAPWPKGVVPASLIRGQAALIDIKATTA